jgi:hypothetical protein
MIRTKLAMLVVALLASAPAFAQVGKDAALQALKGYEIPLTKDRLEKLGPGWEAAMEALARDGSLAPLYRIRALGALAHSTRPSSGALLRSVLAQRASAERGAAAVELRVAVLSLAAVEKDAAVEVLAGFLDHPVPDVRAAAAQALAPLSAAKVRPLLQRRLGRETEGFVKAELEAAVRPAAP